MAYTVASFSQQFPDTPFDSRQLDQVFNNYVNGNGDLAAVTAFQTKLSNQITALQSYQANLVASIPEYTDQSSAPTFLSSISTAATHASTLQTQLDIMNANIEHSQLKLNGNMSAVFFYVYTTATIILGILSIVLITYLVYMYVSPSESGLNTSMKGGKRNPV